MRYRKQSSTGDYVFGAGQRDYGVDTPEVVAQAVVSRLRLQEGEWFMDTSAGTPWDTQVLGANTGSTRDMVVFGAVLGTQGLTKVSNFVASLDATSREYRVGMTIDTLYGTTSVATQV